MAWSGHELTLALASGAASAHIACGRQVADGPLANRVRPGTEQPQRVFRPGRSPVSFFSSIRRYRALSTLAGAGERLNDSPEPGIGPFRNRFLRVFGGGHLLGIVGRAKSSPFPWPDHARISGADRAQPPGCARDFHRPEGPWHLSFWQFGKTLLTRFPRRM